ncbi:MAG: hypothetical protein QME52_12955 [Bacteroidota bacterium]|nr:hypothetical protein [Bacteroidota bacterium]
MKNLIRILLFSVVLFYGASGQVMEDAYRLSYHGLGFGARSLGLGTAYTAVANDFSAVYWNPAGLGQVRSNEFSMGLSHISYNNTSTLFGSKESFSNSGTNINSLGIVYPFPVRRGSLVFAIGYGRQSYFTSALAFTGRYKDNSGLFPDNSLLEAKIFESGGMNNWIVGAAIEAVKGLYIGGSINFISGSYNYNRNYNVIDDKGVYPDTLDSWNQKYTIDEDIGGFTARIGILHTFPDKKGQIGFNIKLPSYFTLRDDFVNDWTVLDDRGRSYYGPYGAGISEFSVTSPFVFSGGASYSFGDLALAGDLEFTDWTQMEFTDADLLYKNNWIKEDMEPTINARIGTELSLPRNNLQLRAGFAYLPSPYKFDSAPNAQKFITGGLGWIVENSVRFDIGYAYGFWQTDHNINDIAYPSEDIQTHNLIATVSYRF